MNIPVLLIMSVLYGAGCYISYFMGFKNCFEGRDEKLSEFLTKYNEENHD